MSLTDVRISDSEISWDSDGISYENKIKNRLQEDSERSYITLVQSIVFKSSMHLDQQNRSKDKLRKQFQIFFIILLSFQIVAMVAFILLSSLLSSFHLSETVIITFITSVFVETLGVIGIMIKFAFDSAQEVKLLEILNGAVMNFQKFTKN